jgi:hypothetical protein
MATDVEKTDVCKVCGKACLTDFCVECRDAFTILGANAWQRMYASPTTYSYRSTVVDQAFDRAEKQLDSVTKQFDQVAQQFDRMFDGSIGHPIKIERATDIYGDTVTKTVHREVYTAAPEPHKAIKTCHNFLCKCKMPGTAQFCPRCGLGVTLPVEKTDPAIGAIRGFGVLFAGLCASVIGVLILVVHPIGPFSVAFAVLLFGAAIGFAANTIRDWCSSTYRAFDEALDDPRGH